MGSITASLLFASLLWGSVGSGYLIYGHRQKSLPAFVGGLVITAASIFAGGVAGMSTISLASMVAVYYFCRRGF